MASINILNVHGSNEECREKQQDRKNRRGAQKNPACYFITPKQSCRSNNVSEDHEDQKDRHEEYPPPSMDFIDPEIQIIVEDELAVSKPDGDKPPKKKKRA